MWMLKAIPYFWKSCLNPINSSFAYCVRLSKEWFVLKKKKEKSAEMVGMKIVSATNRLVYVSVYLDVCTQ